MDEPLASLAPARLLVKTSMSHPINITCLIPPELLSVLSARATVICDSSPTLLHLPEKLFIHNLIVSHSLMLTDATNRALHVALETALSSSLPQHEPDHKPPSSSISVSLSLQLPLSITPSVEPSPEKQQLIGNLFMSSCPGKKVRLNDASSNTGRSAVCRDLDMDLARFKEQGIGCIICCLDDLELEFLGAPWPQYVKAAQRIGIDVLRLPIPEGLPPRSPEYLDTHLTRILNDYTLKGTSVLVHCRGGVGRAGVIACSWLIKLGICGWVKDPPTALTPFSGGDNVNSTTAKKPAPKAMGAQKSQFAATLEFVDTVIRYVRRRRSPKAVETFEQVRFLMQYVDYLKDKAGRAESCALS
ncbi:hypothetical protein CC2G_009163 [Coprinopsis cinerea AmutBmut pab1-1]|nr:hypothetical protein CC2G_009163 [Coprinopsis cinerea AmutBmut pab1-1]